MNLTEPEEYSERPHSGADSPELDVVPALDYQERPGINTSDKYGPRARSLELLEYNVILERLPTLGNLGFRSTGRVSGKSYI